MLGADSRSVSGKRVEHLTLPAALPHSQYSGPATPASVDLLPRPTKHEQRIVREAAPMPRSASNVRGSPLWGVAVSSMT
jgi:hypothetical protein